MEIVLLIFFCIPVVGRKVVGLGPVTMLIVVLDVAVVMSEVGRIVIVVKVVVMIGRVVTGVVLFCG